MNLPEPEGWPSKSLLGGWPSPMTAAQRWALRIEAAKERKAKRSKEVGGNDED
jgi:hypothetical protein